MTAPILAGIDLGTSSLKVVLLDETGRLLSMATADYPILSGAPGEAEQNPEHWWDALRAAMAEAIGRCGGRAGSLIGLGFSGQMHGIVALDAHNHPLRPAIIWADQRGSEEVEEIERLVDRATLLACTGSRASVGFSAPKILWFRHHEPETFGRCRRLLLPKDYLRLRLTGEVATEPTDASATLLFDLARRDWSDRILNRLDLPRELLAPVRATLAQVGTVTPSAAAELSIPAGTPVVAGAGDTPAQAVGYGVLDPGAVLATISTGGQLFAATREPLTDAAGRVHTLCHVTPDRWYVLGALQTAGLALRWFRQHFAPDLGTEGYDRLVEEAAKAPPGSNGLIFLPYLLGERTPHMDNTARAAFFGFTLQHDRAAATRAVLEGVAFAFRDALIVFHEMGLEMDELLLGGGGSRSTLWCRIFADVLGLPVKPMDVEHGAPLGAALLAGLGLGHFRDWAEACAELKHPQAAVTPDPDRVARYSELYGTFRGLYQSSRPHFQALAQA